MSPEAMRCTSATDSRRDWGFAAEETSAGAAQPSGATLPGITFTNVLLAGAATAFCKGAPIEDGEDGPAAELWALPFMLF